MKGLKYFDDACGKSSFLIDTISAIYFAPNRIKSSLVARQGLEILEHKRQHDNPPIHRLMRSQDDPWMRAAAHHSLILEACRTPIIDYT